MQAVKLRPEEVMGVAVRSDWLLLWRVLPKGLPSTGDAGGRKRRVHKKNKTRELHRLITHFSLLTTFKLTFNYTLHTRSNPLHTMCSKSYPPLLGGSLGTCCPGGVEEGGCDASGRLDPVEVSSSPRLEENTRSKEGSLSIHSTLDMGRQLKRI